MSDARTLAPLRLDDEQLDSESQARPGVDPALLQRISEDNGFPDRDVTRRSEHSSATDVPEPSFPPKRPSRPVSILAQLRRSEGEYQLHVGRIPVSVDDAIMKAAERAGHATKSTFIFEALRNYGVELPDAVWDELCRDTRYRRRKT